MSKKMQLVKVASWEEFREYFADGIEIVLRNLITLEYMARTIRGLHRNETHQFYESKNATHYEIFFEAAVERADLGPDLSIEALAKTVSEVLDEALVFVPIETDRKETVQ